MALRGELRTRLQNSRAALTGEQIATAAAHLVDHCLPLLARAAHVAGYLAVEGEMSVTDLLRHCRNQGTITYAPRVAGQALRFLPFDDRSPMRSARFGIQVPDVPDSLAIDPLALDIVLVPLVGFDAGCNRIGMGGGFYDRTFAALRERTPVTNPSKIGRAADSENATAALSAASVPRPESTMLIGCAHARQQVESVLPDWWDVPLDAIVTDEGVIYRPGRSA